MRSMAHSFWIENRSLIVFMLLMVVFRSSFADWNKVPTGSMKPTIVEGDRILVDKMAYDLRVPLTHVSLAQLAEPARGDIVVFDSETAGTRLVKRVIGVPGDRIEMVDNRLLVNGVPALYSQTCVGGDSCVSKESFGGFTHRIRLEPYRFNPKRSFDPVTVPKDEYLVLGDNRDNSADSRYIGFVPRHEIVGRSRSVVMSLDPNNYYLPRNERFFHGL